MSLRPMDENGAKKQKTRRAPKFDSFPELDQIFDEFDSDKRKELGLPEPKREFEKFNQQKPVVKKSLPVFDLDIDDEDFGLDIDDEESENAEENSNSERIKYNQEKDNLKKEDDYTKVEELEDKTLKIETEDDFEEEIVNEDDFEEGSTLPEHKRFLENEPDKFFNSEEEEDFKNVHDEDERSKRIKEEVEKKEPLKKEGDSKFKEIDEEKIKNFFTGIFKRKNKANKETLKKEKKEKGPKEKKSRDENARKERKSLGKKGKIMAIILVAIVLVLGALFILGNKGYEDLSELTFNIDENLVVSNIFVGENSDFTISNNGDISASIFFYVTLQEKGAIPFLGSKIECESDIIDVITGGQTTSKMKCSKPLEEKIKYKYIEASVSEV